MSSFAFEERLSYYPFSDYACNHWFSHARSSETQEKLIDLLGDDMDQLPVAKVPFVVPDVLRYLDNVKKKSRYVQDHQSCTAVLSFTKFNLGVDRVSQSTRWLLW